MFRRPKNAAERLALRPAYVPKGARPILEHENGSALYLYEMAGKLYLISFWGTAHKPYEHCCYRTEEQRAAAVQRFKTGVEQSIALRAEQTARRAADGCTLKAGDIVNTSWGYDQTNVDFFIVTRATRSTVWVRAIAADYEATGHMSGKTWPKMPIEMTGPETMHRARGGSCSIRGHHASLTTGERHTSSYA